MSSEASYNALKNTLARLKGPRANRLSQVVQGPPTIAGGNFHPKETQQQALKKPSHRKLDTEPFSILKELELNETKSPVDVQQIGGCFQRQESYPLSTRDSMANQDDRSTFNNFFLEEEQPSTVIFDQ